MRKERLQPVELPTNLETVGARIRWARRRLEWTQEQLAAALESDQTTVSKWEKNIYSPRDFKRLAEALEVYSPAWLAFGKETIDLLSDDAIELAQAYDELPPAQQSALLAFIRSLS